MIPATAQKKATAEEWAYSRLLSYAKLRWSGYQVGKHHAKIAYHLQAIEKREIKRLLITLPPRHGKTMLVIETFTPWYLGRNPSHQIIFTTYSHEKAADHGLKVKQQLEDAEFYNSVFPDCTLSKDSKSKNKLSTTQGGNFFSTGVGGAIVGRGANLLLMDDLIKSREEAESELVRKRMRSWYKGTAYTRLMPNAAIVFITTRWHEDDLAGNLLEEESGNWVLLNIPAEAEEDDDIIGRKEGEAIWPEMYPNETLNEIKGIIGPREWNAQYQQRPVAEEGGMVKYDWLQYYTEAELPEFNRIVQSWDTAQSEKQINNPSVCLTFGETKTNSYLLDVFEKHLAYPDLVRAAKLQYNSWTPSIVLIEDRASGQSLIQDLRSTTKIPIKAIYPKGSRKETSNKTMRLQSVSGMIESGRLLLPKKARWLVGFVTQLVTFPYGRNDDMVDALSQYLKYATGPKFRRSKKKLYWK